MDPSTVPVSLKSVKPYIERAGELQAKDPIVAYHCRLYALQEAMKARASIPKEDMGFVITLMDALEKEKTAIGEMDSPSVLVENFAQDLFQRADDADRSGKYDMRTGKAYLVASQLIEVCKQFGELPPDLAEKAKYAKWRFVEIAKATKAGTTPPPPRGVDPEPEQPADPAQSDIPPPPEMPPDPTPAAPPMMPPSQPGADPYGLPAYPPPAAPAAPATPAPPAGGLPSYMGLPMAPSAPGGAPTPPVYAPPPVPPAACSGYPSAAPPAPYAAPPAAPGMPPAPGGMHMGMPGMVPGMVPQPTRGPSFKPDRGAMVEAQRLCSSASSALQFQDSDTAVHQLTQALQLLTQPSPIEPPPP